MHGIMAKAVYPFSMQVCMELENFDEYLNDRTNT